MQTRYELYALPAYHYLEKDPSPPNPFLKIG